MERALSATRTVLNTIERHYWNSETAFQHFLAHDDGDALIAYLGVAVKAEERRRHRLLEGRPLPEDFEP